MLTWLVSTEDITPVELCLGNPVVDGSRNRPDRPEFKWKELGVLGILEDFQLSFFIQRLSNESPSNDGEAVSEIAKFEISGDEEAIEEWLGSDLSMAFDGVEIVWVDLAANDGQTKFVAAHL